MPPSPVVKRLSQVYLVHLCFVDILIPQFMTDNLINNILIKVGHLHVYFGMIEDHVKDDCWYI